MNCERFRSDVGQAVRVVAAAELDAAQRLHVAACAACASWYAEHSRVDAMLELLPTMDPPQGFAKRVVARALASESTMRRITRSRSLRAAAVVLFLAGACGVWFATRPDGVHDAVVSLADEPSPELLAEMDLLLDWDVLDQRGAALDVAADADVAVALTQFDVLESGS